MFDNAPATLDPASELICQVAQCKEFGCWGKPLFATVVELLKCRICTYRMPVLSILEREVKPLTKPADCLRTETGYWLGTVKSVFEYILSGTPPWAAIGNFLDDWKYAASSDEQRQAMVIDPLPSAGAELELQRWAAFCAAMVEVLCAEAEITPPEWTARSEYRLAEPWYLYPGKHPEMRAWQEETSPLPFKQRNIMAGDRSLNRA